MINYTFVGIACSVMGNILISLALNIQKRAHSKLQRDALAIGSHNLLAQNTSDSHGFYNYSSASSSLDVYQTLNENTTISPKSLNENYLFSPYWWLGAIVMTVGETGNFIAYGFAPVSIVSSLGIVTIISNCTIAPFIFNDPLRTRDLVGTIIASFGVLLMILSSVEQNGEKKDPDIKPPLKGPSEAIYETLTSYTYLYYVIGSIALASILMLRLSALHINLHAYTKTRNYRMKTLYTFGNLLLVAVFGAHTAMATKCLSTLLQFSPSLWSLFSQFQTYYLLVVLIVTVICQIKFLNNSLRVESSTRVVPVHFVFFTISVLVGSAIVFKDQQNKDFWQICVFLFGCCLTFVSVFIIAGGDRGANSSFGNTFDVEIHVPNAQTVQTEDLATGVTNLSPQNKPEYTTNYFSAVSTDINGNNNDLHNTNNKKNTFQYSEFAFKVPSLDQPTNPQKTTSSDSKIGKKKSKSSLVSGGRNNNDFLTDSLLQDDGNIFYISNQGSSESVPFLSRSTSINDFYSLPNANYTAANNHNVERGGYRTTPGNHLAISGYNNNNDNDIRSSRSGPGNESADDVHNHARYGSLLNRSRSFNRIAEFNSSKSELVGIPGSGSLILSLVLTSLNKTDAKR